LQQQIAALCAERAPAQQQLAELDCKISKLEEQLGQLQAAEDLAAIDAAASQEQDSEDLEMIPIRSQSQCRRCSGTGYKTRSGSVFKRRFVNQ
jgi:hypothetical protein